MEITPIIIQDILQQARNGFIRLGSVENGVWQFFTGFSTIINGHKNIQNPNFPIINIPDYKLFVEKVDKYLTVAKDFYAQDKEYFDLDSSSHLKKLFLDLMVNATNYDINNIYQFIDLRTKMVSTNLPIKNFKLGEFNNLDVHAKIKKNRSNLESPYRFELTFKDKENEENAFKLPAVLFSVVDDKAYIMAIQNSKQKQTTPLAKQLDRYFRKVNKGVDMEDEIGNVSPNALVALTLFNSYMQQNNINQIKASDFFPIRYNSNLSAGFYKFETEEKKQEFVELHNRNQFNMTNKFMYVFLRYAHHFDNVETNYDIIKQEMTTYLDNNAFVPDDNIIGDLHRCVNVDRENQLISPISQNSSHQTKKTTIESTEHISREL